MISNEERRRIEDEIKLGATLYNISQKYNIPEETLEEWKRDMQIRHNAKTLILQGKIDKAREEMEELQSGEFNELVKMALSAMIEKKQGNREAERDILNQILGIDKDNIVATGMLINCTAAIGDIDGYRRTLDIKLQQEPDNMKIINSRLALACKEGDIEKQKKMLDLKVANLAMVSDKIGTLSKRIGIAMEEGDKETIQELGYLVLQKRPKEKRIKEIFRQFGIGIDKSKSDRLSYLKVEVEEDIEESFTDVPESVAQKARQLIYENQDVIAISEEIKELLEGESDLDRELIVAELYASVGVTARAQKSLSAYKKTLDKDTQSVEIKLVNRALEIIRNGKVSPIEKRVAWKNLWRIKDRSRYNAMPSVPGEDGNR